MSDDEINAAIALHLGWNGVVSCPGIGVMGIPPAKNECDPVFLRNSMWTKDLNAMHEAEKSLNMQQWRIYLMHLASFMQDICHATAKEKAKAFLKTFGKWKGAQP